LIDIVTKDADVFQSLFVAVLDGFLIETSSVQEQNGQVGELSCIGVLNQAVLDHLAHLIGLIDIVLDNPLCFLYKNVDDFISNDIAIPIVSAVSGTLQVQFL